MKKFTALSLITGMMFSVNKAPAHEDRQVTNCNVITYYEVSEKAVPLWTLLVGNNHSVQCIESRISAYRFGLLSDEIPNVNNSAESFLVLTGAGINLVRRDFKFIREFRENYSDDFIHALVAGTGHPDQIVRRNSAELLAHLIDFDKLDIVLSALLHLSTNLEELEIRKIQINNLVIVVEGLLERADQSQRLLISDALNSIQSDISSLD